MHFATFCSMELTMTALRIADPLAERARKEAKLMHRSLAAQVEHWAWLGARLEESGLSLDTIKALKSGDLPAANGAQAVCLQERAADIFANIGNPAAHATARAELLAHGLPLYGRNPQGDLVREIASGAQTRGVWDVERNTFVADE